MKIVSIGGGPAGLYFSILMKKADASHEISVIERNRPYDTFGWGVVFSDETLSNFEHVDKETHDEIVANFAYWGDIDTFYHDQCIRSSGHGFAGMSRKKLLNIFQARAEGLGVKLVFETEVDSLEPYRDADLILGADGVKSFVRGHLSQHFKPSIDWRKCKFCWFGADLVLPAFTFIYRESEHGLFQVHAYPFDEKTSTFIVECREETWKRAGLDRTDEAGSVAYCEKLFRKELAGHKLLTNKSLWRTFPIVSNQTWHHENVVLVGDAAHTAHFSIGSGTKLAMEDAMALFETFQRMGCDDVPAVLATYQDARWVDTAKLQKTARTSLEWFENSYRYMKQDPIQFTFNQITRSKRITWDNLKLRDPVFIEKTAAWFARQNPHRKIQVLAPEYARDVEQRTLDVDPENQVDPPSPETAPPIFQPYKLRGMELVNRLVVSPMCMYSATDGLIDDWHLVHLGSRAIGGAGLVYGEATSVSAQARLSLGDAGIWNDEQAQAWARVVEFIHGHTKAKTCMQLAHGGRKASGLLPWEGPGPLPEAQGWELIAASPLPYDQGWPAPREMTREDMDGVRDDFVSAAGRALESGFDMIELHMAHGYLFSSFLSPLTNRRGDEYGGSIENRLRFPLEVLDAVRAVWPEERPMSVRISATDWKDGGTTDEDRVAIGAAFRDHGLDILDISAGGVVPDQEPVYGRFFQTPFSDLIRNEAGIATIAVGNIQTIDQANTILASGRADLIAMARPHLGDPYTLLHAAEDYDYDLQYWPPQYLAAKPRRRKG